MGRHHRAVGTFPNNQLWARHGVRAYYWVSAQNSSGCSWAQLGVLGNLGRRRRQEVSLGLEAGLVGLVRHWVGVAVVTDERVGALDVDGSRLRLGAGQRLASLISLSHKYRNGGETTRSQAFVRWKRCHEESINWWAFKWLTAGLPYWLRPEAQRSSYWASWMRRFCVVMLISSHLLSIVELAGVLVAALIILVKRLADNLDQRLVLRGGDGGGHDGEQQDLWMYWTDK